MSHAAPATALTAPQLHAARYVVARVRAEVAAELVQASLFGSRARGDARPDSDVDLLLVFRELPPDREPHATRAERIAAQEARRHRIPVTVWSVSLIDLALGNRTPMLVDALADSIPLWCRGEPLPPIDFTPRDALGCSEALLRRVAEGSEALAFHLVRGDVAAASRRLRDDLVRLCTAAGLLAGVTRPRRAQAVRAQRERERDRAGPRGELILSWAERSFGPDGTDEERRVAPPPLPLPEAAAEVEALRRTVARRARALCASLDATEASPGQDRLGEWSLRSRG